MKKSQYNQESGILLGVPRVQYCPEGLTPFPSCLNACANYMGIDVTYDYTMAASGAAFRLTWDETEWNLGNVDTVFTYSDPERIYRQGIEAIGCHFNLLNRKKDTQKSEFIAFIKEQIDKGNPVIALGMIGPPEACIVTGYRDRGETLLGWSFFQDNPEFNSDMSFDESGYFITERWWDNPDTIAVMSLEPANREMLDVKTILNNALEVMEGRKDGNYVKGLLAYDAWASAVGNDSEFPEGLILPLLAERLLTHGDAIDCIADGRYHAAAFIKKAAALHPEQKPLFSELEQHFMAVFELHKMLFEVTGGWERGESQMRKFAEADVRRKTVKLISQAQENDKKAFDTIKQLVASL